MTLYSALHTFKRSSLFAISVILLNCTGVYAQDAQTLDTLIVLKKLEVSTSRIPQTAAGSGRNITIIPATLIQRLPVHSTDEVLRYISGVEVQSRGAFGTQSDFSIRGSTFSQVLVLIDGMRLNDPLTAHFNSNIPVAPSEIKRIEVLHGPAAAQYGADAVGGVINIVTKTFNASSSRQTAVDVKAGYGQYNLKVVKAGFYHDAQNVRIGGGGFLFHTPGQPLYGDYRNRFSIGNASLSAGFRLGNGWDLALRSAYDHRDFNAKYFYTASPYDQSREKVTAWWNQFRLTNTSGNQVTTLEGSFKHNTDTYRFTPSSPANEHTTHLLNVQLYQYNRLSSVWGVTYGLQTTNRLIRSNDRGNHSDWHYAAYSMLQWQPLSQFTVTGSMRVDHDESYGTELMPQLSASYSLDHWTFRASGGRSIRAPSYTERFVSTNLEGPVAAGRNIGNPWLEAEQSWSGEAGVDVFPLNNIRFSVTGFLRHSSNLIDYVVRNSRDIRNNSNLQTDVNYLYTSNLSSVRTAGVELGTSMSRTLGRHWLLNAILNYTFVNSYNDENVTSKYISNYARNLVNGMISLRNGPFELALTGLWKQREDDRAEAINFYKASTYNVWNLKVSYEIYENFTLGVEIDNLFNKEYQDILGAQMPERWIMGTVAWNFRD